MRQATERKQDTLRYSTRADGFVLRAIRLRLRAETAGTECRHALLTAMEESYIAAGLALTHSLAGSVDAAHELDKMANERLALARRYFQKPALFAE